MALLSLLKYITSHPLNKDAKVNAVFRFAKWQLNTKVNPYPIIYPITDKANLIIKKGMTGVTQNLYCGLHDYQEMFFLLHFLRKQDVFLDIGANVGSYTVLAAAHVGAKTFSFEPVPVTFSHLLNNIHINGVNNLVTALNIGIGAKAGLIDFTRSLDTVNHVATKDDQDVITVKIDTLDNLLKEDCPSLIKIDVEGFETEVLKGAGKTLERQELKAIMIELNGSGARYGYNENDIHKALLGFGFAPYNYKPTTRELEKLENFGTHNTIYIRDIGFVKNRLQSSEKVKILNKLI